MAALAAEVGDAKKANSTAAAAIANSGNLEFGNLVALDFQPRRALPADIRSLCTLRGDARRRATEIPFRRA
jgi:hypothetical protein